MWIKDQKKVDLVKTEIEWELSLLFNLVLLPECTTRKQKEEQQRSKAESSTKITNTVDTSRTERQTHKQMDVLKTEIEGELSLSFQRTPTGGIKAKQNAQGVKQYSKKDNNDKKEWRTGQLDASNKGTVKNDSFLPNNKYNRYLGKYLLFK